MDIKWNSIEVAPPKPGDYYGCFRAKKHGEEDEDEFCKCILTYIREGIPAVEREFVEKDEGIPFHRYEEVPPNSWLLSDYRAFLNDRGYLDPDRFEGYWTDTELPSD